MFVEQVIGFQKVLESCVDHSLGDFTSTASKGNGAVAFCLLFVFLWLQDRNDDTFLPSGRKSIVRKEFVNGR